jgi:hypothetical protein
MREELPFYERVLRVTHSHIAHRALPPTRFEPWTQTKPDTNSYRQFIGYRCINTETDEVSYCCLVPGFAQDVLPYIDVHYGLTGDPAEDPIVARVQVVWDDV